VTESQCWSVQKKRSYYDLVIHHQGTAVMCHLTFYNAKRHPTQQVTLFWGLTVLSGRNVDQYTASIFIGQ
jgi:hypothetical protein